jgi:hypothetical protein
MLEVLQPQITIEIFEWLEIEIIQLIYHRHLFSDCNRYIKAPMESPGTYFFLIFKEKQGFTQIPKAN